jgi:protein-S-isoprenylcysteine O-methyltransferase Ste14
MIVRSVQMVELAWIAWLISWLTASLWSNRAQKRIASAETWTYRTAQIAGGILLAPPTAWTLSETPLWEFSFGGASLPAGMMLFGFFLTWWARIHLGHFWSGVVTRKEDHKLIDAGPYAFVRHPIYTGLVIALFATATLEGTIPALLGAALMTFGFWLKARSEEQFLRIELSPEYRAYCRRVPMLVPFTSRGGRFDKRRSDNQ